MIDHDVSCKFCNQGFFRDPSLISNPETPGFSPAGKDALLDRTDRRSPFTLNQKNGNGLDVWFKPWLRTSSSPTSSAGGPLRRSRCASHVTGSPRQHRPPGRSSGPSGQCRGGWRETVATRGRVRWLERTLAGFAVAEGEIRVDGVPTPIADEAMARQSREEIARLRRTGPARRRPKGRRRRTGSATSPGKQSQRSPQPSPGQSPPRTPGNGRVLTTRPPQAARGATRPPSRAGGNGVHMGVAFDRLSKCEQLADGLVDQLKTSREEKTSILTEFAQVLERLQEVLGRVDGDLERANVEANRRPVGGTDPGDSCGLIVPVSSMAAEAFS